MKWFALVGLVLFLGIAGAPSINAQSNEYVTITSDVCSYIGVNQEYSIPREKADELVTLFNVYQNELEHTSTTSEAASIFREMSNYLLDCNIIDISTKNRLNHQLNQWLSCMELLDKKRVTDEFNVSGNSFCVVIGNTTDTRSVNFFRRYYADTLVGILDVIGFIYSFFTQPNVLYYLLEPIFWTAASLLFAEWVLFPMSLTTILPFGVMNHFIIGYELDDAFSYPEIYPAKGVLTTYGTQGNMTWEGSFYGQIKTMYTIWNEFYIGIAGFTGLKISLPKSNELFYFGFARKVDVDTKIPS